MFLAEIPDRIVDSEEAPVEHKLVEHHGLKALSKHFRSYLRRVFQEPHNAQKGLLSDVRFESNLENSCELYRIAKSSADCP